MTQTGYFGFTTAATDSSVGTVDWTNPSNALTVDFNNAIVTLPYNESSYYLKLTQLASLSIPSYAFITDISIVVYCSSSALGPAVTSITDARIVKAGVIGGDNGTPVNRDIYGAGNTIYIGTGLWGNTLSVADVSSTGFGVAISVGNFGIDMTPESVGVEAIGMNITYETSEALLAM